MEAAAKDARGIRKRLEIQVQEQSRQIHALHRTNRENKSELDSLRASIEVAAPVPQPRDSEATRKLEADVRRLTQQLREVEQASKKELAKMVDSFNAAQRGNEAAESQAEKARARAGRMEAETRRLQHHIVELERACRLKEEEAAGLQQQVRESSREHSDAEGRYIQASKRSMHLESDMSSLRHLLASAEEKIREKEREVVAWEDRAQQWGRQLKDAEERAHKADSMVAKAESEAAQAKQRLLELEQDIRVKTDDLARLASETTELRGQSADANILADRKSQELQGLERSAQHLRQANAQLEHHCRSQEREADKLKARLAEKVAREERRVRRDKDVYDRLRRAHSSSRKGLAGKARIAVAEKRVAELLRDLNSSRAEAVDASRQSARRVAEAETRAEKLAEENASLIMELNMRPTAKDLGSCHRQIALLERRLLRARSTGDAGSAAEAGEREIGAQLAGVGPLTTRERIQRDREINRLHLQAVDHLPRDVLAQLVQDVCICLDLDDATHLKPAVLKVLRVVDALPRLEAFVAEVCEIVLGRTAPCAAASACDPSQVPATLRAWVQSLRELDVMRGAVGAIRRTLSSRVDAESDRVIEQAEVELQIQQLVEHERNSLTAIDAIRAAEGILEGSPNVLLNRVVKHFQNLFDCQNLAGAIPAMNRIYMTVTECRNFLRSLSLILGLAPESGVQACMARVRQLLDQRGQSLDLKDDYIKGQHPKSSPRRAADEKENIQPCDATCQGKKSPQGQRDTEGSLGDSIVVAVMTIFQVSLPSQVLPLSLNHASGSWTAGIQSEAGKE
eukprot:evm.model.scf_855.2 EVM.evm.TU.scf_855.2   scf_855:24944-33980(+)